MGVYTPLDAAEVQAFLDPYGLGRLEALEPIPAGIENTNYRVTAGGAAYVLTVFEREAPADAETALRLTAALAARGTPCPAPVPGPGGPLSSLKGKPAALVPFVEGETVWSLTEGQLEAVGRALARLHRAGAGIAFRRDGPHLSRVLAPLARSQAAALVDRRPDAAEWAELAELLRREAAHQEGVPEAGLPSGVIHSDLFRDNILFEAGGEEVRALLDFYLWGWGPWVYDVAVVLLDACWGEGGVDGDRARALLRGYRSVRPLEGDEYACLPDYLRRAALRFLCLRIERAYLAPSPLTAGRAKDPRELAERLRALRSPGRRRSP